MEQGRRSATFARVVAPLTIVSDIARGVVREPRFGAGEGLRLWNSTLLHKLTLGDGKFFCHRTTAYIAGRQMKGWIPDTVCQCVSLSFEYLLQ